MKGRLRVVTFNIWNRLGEWEAREVGLRRVIEGLDADVLALQEVISIEGFDQAELLGKLHPHRVFAKPPESAHPLGNAILSRFPILASSHASLPDGGTDERRVAVHARLAAPFGQLDVFCTHLNWKFDEGHVREAQVKALVRFIEETAPPDGRLPPVLLGDFNADPDADEMRFLRGQTSLGLEKRVHYLDCFEIAGEGPGHTFSKRNANAEPLREPERRIDYVFVRGPDPVVRLEPLAARVIGDAPVGGVFPSDHFGVMADLGVH